uniref:Uncharacterized protein n=1 Tax=Sipha flava TaxID=143950 RepID=A0A2S2PYE7_9HEMI
MTMKILCKVIEVDGYKWSCPSFVAHVAAADAFTRNIHRRCRFGNHSNLTADAAPDWSKTGSRVEWSRKWRLRRTDIPFINSGSNDMHSYTLTGIKDRCC